MRSSPAQRSRRSRRARRSGGVIVHDAANDFSASTSAAAKAALLFDLGGDDTYNLGFAPAATAMGVGHDFSASFHLDLGGNDH